MTEALFAEPRQAARNASITEDRTQPALLRLPFPETSASDEACDIPRATLDRLHVARERLLTAALNGERIRSYEVALDVDMSEFHFARQFRLAFGKSPHVFYDEARAARARELLAEGLSAGEVARRIGFRRPAELRALLQKR